MTEITWKCHVCGDERPDALIGVYKTDRSAEWKMPPGTFVTNVRYCLDRPGCLERAASVDFGVKA